MQFLNQPLSKTTLAIGALILGSAALAFAPIFVRLADTSPAASGFWRMALAAPVLWLWVAFEARRQRDTRSGQQASAGTRTPWALLTLAGAFFAADVAALHEAIVRTSVANASLELNLAPLWVTLGAWLLFRQRVSRGFLLALLITTTGAAMTIGPNFRGSPTALAGDALGVLAGVFYACYMLTIKSVTASVSTARIMAVNTSAAALLLAPYALMSGGAFLPQSGTGWLLLTGLAVGVHVAGQSLVAYGFASLPAQLSSVNLLLQPVFAALYAWMLLGEAMLPLQIAGALVVLFGIYLAKRGS